MAGSHVEEGGEQVRGKDSCSSTRGRKDKSCDAISSLEGRFVKLELGVANTKEGMDLLEQSMEKAVEDLKVQIQDLQEGMQSSSIHAVSHEEFVTFQDRSESLMDYKESMSSNDEGSRVSHSSGGGKEVSPRGSEDDCSTDGGEEVPRSTAKHGKGKVSYTRKDKGKRKQRESTPKLKCFLCDGPHLTR